MNWKKWNLRFLKAFGIFILNGASWSWLVMNFIGTQEVEINMMGIKKVIDVSFWDTLLTRYKILIYVLMIAFAILSIWIVMKWYQHYREDYKFVREDKIRSEREKKEKLLTLKKLERKSKTQPLSKKEMELLEELMKETK